MHPAAVKLLRSFSSKTNFIAALFALLWVAAAADIQGWPLMQSRRALFSAAGMWAALSLLFAVLLPAAWRVFKHKRRSSQLGWGLVCLLIGMMTVTFIPYPTGRLAVFPARLQVKIQPAGGADCSATELLGFEADGHFVSYNTLTLDGWERRDTSLVSLGSEGAFTWQGYARDTKLIFRSTENNCTVRVTWDGHSTPYPLQGRLQAAYTRDVVIHDLHPQPAALRFAVRLAMILSASSVVLLLLALALWSWGTLRPGGDPQPREPFFASPTDRLWVLIPALLGTLLLLVATRTFGVFMWTDTSSYVSAARSLAAGQGYIMASGDVFDWWPPLYPVLLAPAYLLKWLNPLVYGRFLNAACLFLTLTGWGILVLRALPSIPRVFFATITLAAAVSAPLLGAHIYLLSEPSFILCITWCFVFLQRYLDCLSAEDAAMFAVFAGLAALSRYMGLTVVAAGAAAVFLFQPERFSPAALVRRALRTAAWGLFAVYPMLVWLYHNYTLKQGLTGLRTPSETPLWANVNDFLSATAGWFAPSHHLAGAVMLGAALGLFLFCVAAPILRRRASQVELSVQMKLAAGLLLFVMGYTLYIIISLTIIANSPISNRLMSPIYLPLLALLLILLDTALPSRMAPARLGAAALLVIMLAVPAMRFLIDTARSPIITAADQLSIYSLQGDQVLARLAEQPLQPVGTVYSNCPRCLCIFSGIYNAQNFDEQPINRPYLPKPGSEPVTVVWFNRVSSIPDGRPEGTYQSDIAKMQQVLDGMAKTPLFESADGGIYWITVPER